MAIVEVTQSIYFGGDFQAYSDAAETASARALTLRPDDPITQVAAGLVALNGKYDPQAAVAHYSKALQLAPNLTMAHQFLAEALSAVGEHERAIAAADAAVALEPVSSLQHGVRSIVLNAAGRWQEAVEAADHALLLDGHYWILRYQAFALYRLGDIEGVTANYRKLTELQGETPEVLDRLDHLIEKEGLQGYWAWLIGRFQYLESQGIEARPMDHAEALAGTGQGEDAMIQLEKAVSGGDGACFLQLRFSPAFDSIRNDPRFVAFYRSAGSSPEIVRLGPSLAETGHP